MAFIDDLAKANVMLRQGLQDMGTLQAVRNANEQVQFIKQQELDETGKQIDEMQKRAQTQQVANDLTQQLAVSGVTGQRLQALVGSVSPIAAPTGAERIDVGFQTGDKDLISQGKEQLTARAEPTMALQRMKSRFALETKMLERSIGTALSDKQLELIGGQEDALFNAEDIRRKASKNTGLLGPTNMAIPDIWDKDLADFRSQIGRFILSYQKSISGAQVTNQEREFIKDNLPSANDRPDVFKKKMGTLIRIGNRVRQKTLKRLRQGGRDVSRFPENDPELGGVSEASSQFIMRR
jgi:hypothetical protein